MKNKEEEFKEIPGLPGYFISTHGRLRRGIDKLVKLHNTKKGYVVYQIMYNGSRISGSVHRLVAKTFLGDIEGMEVDHLDFNKENNHVSNLEIVTRSENMRRYHTSELSSEIREAARQKASESHKERWSKIERTKKPKVYTPRPKKENPNKGGRPKFSEPLTKTAVYLWDRQLPVTAEEIRNALDFYRKSKAAFEAEKAAWLIENENPNAVKIGSPIPGKQDIADM